MCSFLTAVLFIVFILFTLVLFSLLLFYFCLPRGEQTCSLRSYLLTQDDQIWHVTPVAELEAYF